MTIDQKALDAAANVFSSSASFGDNHLEATEAIIRAYLAATPQVQGEALSEGKLGRFGWNPDPAIDFEIEVGDIEAEIYHHKVGFENGTPPLTELVTRIDRAMSFRVGAIETCVLAKHRLRELEKEAAALTRPPKANIDAGEEDAHILAVVEREFGSWTCDGRDGETYISQFIEDERNAYRAALSADEVQP